MRSWILLSAFLLPAWQTVAQRPLETIDLFGKKYDIFQIPRVGPIFPTVLALGNRQVFTDTFGTRSISVAVGYLGNPGYAISYSPEGGLGFLISDQKAGEDSRAEDISDNGTIIGWYQKLDVQNRLLPPRAFIWSNNDGLKFLDDLYPKVRALAEIRHPDETRPPGGTRGLRINRKGEMILSAAPKPQGPNTIPGLFRVSPEGEITPVTLSESGSDLNNDGKMPPRVEGQANIVINDLGDYAGTIPVGVGSLDFVASIQGVPIPDSRGSRPSSINAASVIGATPGVVFTRDGIKTDIRKVIWEQGVTAVFKTEGQYLSSSSELFVNDGNDISWANLILRPACPDVTLRARLGDGFEIGPGGVSVRVGGRFKSTAILRNDGRAPLRDVRVTLEPQSALFRLIGEPKPPVPTTLDPGQIVESEFEWEVVAPGNVSAAFALRGTSECGPTTIQLPPATVRFVEAPISVTYRTFQGGVSTNQVPICDDFEVTATITNLTGSVLEKVFPLSPLTNGANGTVRILGVSEPSTPQTMAPNGVIRFTWRARGIHVGAGNINGSFGGNLGASSFRTAARDGAPIEVLRRDLVVNEFGDDADEDPTDDCPDVDAEKQGLQTTLRAAIEVANSVKGRDTILFNLARDGANPGSPMIRIHRPLPIVVDSVEIRGRSQPGGGWVGVEGSDYRGKDSESGALEFRADSSVSGMAFAGFSSGSALALTGGESSVEGCRFGIGPDGKPSGVNAISIRVGAGGQQIGGVLTNQMNSFLGGDVGILVAKPGKGVVPSGVLIEGNQFGNMTASGFRSGPRNAIVIGDGRGCRIGGTVPGARNIFIGSSAAAVLLLGPETSETDVIGNWFGLRPAGTLVALGEWNGYGVGIAGGAHHNRIGGVSASRRNVIAGSDSAGVVVTLGAHDNVVEGNWIGLSADGRDDAQNEVGIWVVAGANNRIGGPTPGQRNIISGNLVTGIIVGRGRNQQFKRPGENPGEELCTGTIIEGNWIGLDPFGLRANPNGRSWNLGGGDGILVLSYAKDTVIGGVSIGRRNVISGNQGNGVEVNTDAGLVTAIVGNHIGTSPDGFSPVANKGNGISVLGDSTVTIGGVEGALTNRIAYNGGPGVNLTRKRAGSSAVQLFGNLIYNNNPAASILLATPRAANDQNDEDIGPNGRQNWPMLLGAFNRDGITEVLVDISSFAPGIPVRVDLFRAAGGGGDFPIGSLSVTTRERKKDRYLVEARLQFVGTEITALATTAEGTSEFSPAIPVVSGRDSDGDGIPDAYERVVPVVRNSNGAALAGPNSGVPVAGDRNGDGVLDELQAGVASARIPSTDTWITVSAGAGRSLTDIVGIRPGNVPQIAGSTEVRPGAVRFTLGGGSGTRETVRLWYPPEGSDPTLSLLTDEGWIQLEDVEFNSPGALDCVLVQLPARPADSDWVIAFGRPRTAIGPVRLSVQKPELRSVGRNDESPLPAFQSDSEPISGGSPVWMTPVRFAWPEALRSLQLETSANLVDWLDVESWPEPGEPELELAWPISEGTRFFRWRRDY